MPTLPVELRDANGPKAAVLRRDGKVPAVVYGPHQSATSISIDALLFTKVLREAGESSIVTLSGLGEELPTLIHEVDRDPVTYRPRHVDFYAVTKGEKIEVAIPLEFVGESAAVKAGANLVKVMHEVEVKADPMSLPHAITVDISALAEIDQQIHAKDLALPKGVELVTDAEDVVVLTQAVVEEKEEAAAPADLSAIEVEEKGKEKTEEAPETKE